MMNFFMSLANGGSSEQPVIEDIFDGNFNRSSINYTIGSVSTRSPHSTYKFTYSGTYLAVNAYSTNSIYLIFTIKVNGAVFTTQTITDIDTKYLFTLPSGFKDVEIIESYTRYNVVSNMQTFITAIELDSTKYTKSVVNVTDKLLIIGDSITAGSRADFPESESMARLFLYTGGIETTCLASGSLQVSHIASTQTELDNLNAGVTSAFTGVAGVKKVVCALGTNDWGSTSIDKATFKARYEDFIDEIYSVDNSIIIFCLSPIIRSGEDTRMSDFRDAISEVCTARPTYTTYINCATILQLTDLVDGIHPNTAGHLLYYNSIQATINA